MRCLRVKVERAVWGRAQENLPMSFTRIALSLLFGAGSLVLVSGSARAQEAQDEPPPKPDDDSLLALQILTLDLNA